ncbi:hypothetical protein FA15DRAFT_664444 [Coprinopsis marcescibilis]|uniref:Uncharacterized protein n=1 Tax=Coprinopsis marcescibilis TaxID=230819 RepID=A0A5C3L7X4_COPMA|nr:hypothetical protein FA15DRAFT_664444 [Coprinopsis marcescibilis]
MFKSIAIVSAAVVVAYAQTNPLIPTGISSGCRTFLNTLNSDQSLAQCTSALTTALDPFLPGSNSNVTPAQITSALNAVCAESGRIPNACPESVITNHIAAFGAACSDELLTNANEDVVVIYDILYSLIPMQKSVCSKNDEGNWCVLSGAPVTTSTADQIQESLYTQNGDTVTPNIGAFSANNIPFIGISPSLEKDALCTVCTRNVLRNYINFQSSIPYTPGVINSKLLARQTDLFGAVAEQCGESFMSSEVKAAGSLGDTLSKNTSGAAGVDARFQGFVAVVAGLVTLAVSAAL